EDAYVHGEDLPAPPAHGDRRLRQQDPRPVSSRAEGLLPGRARALAVLPQPLPDDAAALRRGRARAAWRLQLGVRAPRATARVGGARAVPPRGTNDAAARRVRAAGSVK